MVSQGEGRMSNQFDWRIYEERINSLPNFRMTIEDPKVVELRVHFYKKCVL